MQVFHFVSWLEQLSKLLSLCSPESFSVFFEWKTFQYSIAFDFAPSNGWSLYEESEHDTIYHTSVNNRHTKATHWIFTATNNRGKYFLKRNSHLFLKPCTVHGMFLEWWNRTKVFPAFDNIFHVYLMREFQKYKRNWSLTMVFLTTSKIAQPIQPIWQHLFALPYSALKKLLWEFNFVHIFWISWSSRPKNVVKCWRDFLSYFTTLWIYREWLILSLIGNNFCIWVFAQVHTSIPRFRRGSDLWF